MFSVGRWAWRRTEPKMLVALVGWVLATLFVVLPKLRGEA